jgi:hypothetical protein
MFCKASGIGLTPQGKTVAVGSPHEVIVARAKREGEGGIG